MIRKKYWNNIKQLQGELYDQGNFVDKGIRLGKNNKVGDIQKFLTSKNYLTDRDVDGILGKKTITAIQRYLNDSGYDSGKIDGIIGGKTKAALSQYNKDFFVDGIIGRRTINAYKKVYLINMGLMFNLPIMTILTIMLNLSEKDLTKRSERREEMVLTATRGQ